MTKFNTAIAGGKWKDFMLQPHIDYGDVAKNGPNNTWQEPEINNNAIPDVIYPAVQRITLPAAAALGVAIDGSDQWWPTSPATPTLPALSPHQSQAPAYIDVYNRGQAALSYEIKPGALYLKVTPAKGTIQTEVRATLSVDWSKAPTGTTQVPVTITG